MTTLTILNGPRRGEVVQCHLELVIGREGADLEIDDAEMSRRHAAVRTLAHGVEIEDLESLNGTFVNGQRVAERTVLQRSGTMRLGMTEIAVDLAPVVTGPRPADSAPIADPQATSLRATEKPSDVPIASPDATVQRALIKPSDVPIASPDATVQRALIKPSDVPIASPDATVQRATLPAAGAPEPALPAPALPKIPLFVRVLAKSAAGRRILQVLIRLPEPVRKLVVVSVGLMIVAIPVVIVVLVV